MTNMPILPLDMMLDGWQEDDARIIRAAFTSRGVSAGGRLRASKPFKTVKTLEEGCANYTWRMLCFDLVGYGKHACMPVCADFDIRTGYDIEEGHPDRNDCEACRLRAQAVRNMTKAMDALITQAESVLPVGAMKGILRWKGLV